MPNRLPNEKRAELWAAYQERQSIDYVSKKCGVHHKTVERYRHLDSWDQRLTKARAAAQERADYSLADAMADNLRLVRAYKERVAQALESKTVSTDDVTAAELERVIRLEAFVLGGAESRHQVVTDFASWSDEELEEFARDGTTRSTSGGAA